MLTGRRSEPRSTAVGFVAARVLLVCGVALLASAAFTITDPGRALAGLAGLGAACMGAGEVMRRRWAVPVSLPAASVHAAVAVGWLLLLALGTAAYLATGAVRGVGPALLESTTGFTTTAISVLPSLEALPRGVLFWRAATQWLGGYAALIVVVAVLPTLGVGGSSGEGTDQHRLHLRSPRIGSTARRLGIGYVVLSAAGVVLFQLAGMGPFDSITYAMTTISTGGFGNHDGSIAHFQSAAVEWVTAGGMALGGLNLALVLSAVRGQLTPLRQSLELRAYAAAIAVGTALLVWWTAPPAGPDWTTVRQSFFATTSAVSTTGHTVQGWEAWPPGPGVLLVLLAAVGAMSGATGGGFRIVRALTLLGAVRREVIGQLHPRSVVVVKVGRAPVNEAVVAQMIGYQVGWVVLAGLGAMALALAGLDLPGAMSGAVSALATWGPGLGALAPDGIGASASALGTQGAATGTDLLVVAAMAPLMLAGRLEIAPLAVGLSTGAAAVRRRLRARRWLRRRPEWRPRAAGEGR